MCNGDTHVYWKWLGSGWHSMGVLSAMSCLGYDSLNITKSNVWFPSVNDESGERCFYEKL